MSRNTKTSRNSNARFVFNDSLRLLKEFITARLDAYLNDHIQFDSKDLPFFYRMFHHIDLACFKLTEARNLKTAIASCNTTDEIVIALKQSYKNNQTHVEHAGKAWYEIGSYGALLIDAYDSVTEKLSISKENSEFFKTQKANLDAVTALEYKSYHY